MFAYSSVILVLIFEFTQSTPIPISKELHPGKLLDIYFKIIVNWFQDNIFIVHFSIVICFYLYIFWSI